MKAVEQSPREGLIWSGATSARLRTWPHDPLCAHLILTGSYDSIALPSHEVIADWQDTARRWGYRAMRTSALPVSLGHELAHIGFSAVQHLALLSVAHDDAVQFDLPRDATPRPVRRRSLLSGTSTLAAVLDIDATGFAHPWRLDAAALHDAFRATATSRVFVSRRGRHIDGFVLTGVTARTGFIQRLAVHPASRRSGTATRLVARALEWNHKKGCATTIVNTETSNNAALSLYGSLGFHSLPDGLVVMECDLS